MSGFDYITSPEQLPIAQVKQSGSSWQQYLPTSSAVGANFSSGQITIPWALNAGTFWDPRKSFIRMVVEISYPSPLVNPNDTGTANGSPFLPYMSTAPSYLLGQCFFSRATFSMNGVIVSQVNDNLPQIGAFMHRMTKANAQNYSFENSLDFTDPSFSARQGTVTATNSRIPQIGDQDLTVSLYDISGWYPAPSDEVKATLAGAAIQIQAPGALAAGWTGALAYLKQGMLVTVLINAAQGVAYSGTIEKIAATADTLTLEVGNVVGLDLAVGSAGKPATVLFTSLVPKKVITNRFEIMVQPPLSIFQSNNFIPGGSFSVLELTPWPQSVYQTRCVETLGLNKIAGRDFQVNVLDLSMQLYAMNGPRIENLQWMLSLDAVCDVQIQSVTSAGTNQLVFNVPSSSYILAAALQNRSAGQVTHAPATKFTVGYPANSPGLEQSLTRLLITYRGVTQPAALQSMGYKGYSPSLGINPPQDAGINLDVLRYMQNGQINGLGFQSGGFESFAEALDAGPMYVFYFPSDASAESNRCQVTFTTDKDLTGTAPGSVGANLLLFSVSRQLATMTIDSGRYTSVNVQNL